MAARDLNEVDRHIAETRAPGKDQREGARREGHDSDFPSRASAEDLLGELNRMAGAQADGSRFIGRAAA